ncbi:hypothetical protein CFOL_v3_11278 [Cephalotus follicularis]|uniref:C2 domain-containing protein n=1 Tax=Cephalotus follicularis TaxID=3775 RepID=A0A1Q3BIT6_CEPFO|nr:hypothetical protein CFOL_v3_11278 [Cephalotus follicularis]
MGKKCVVQVCLISARGLRHRSFWVRKLQWFAVGWIDPNIKYCTNMDASGNSNPVWKTKFATLVDVDDDTDTLQLHVQVFSREPIFLGERLQGTATIALKEFLSKQYQQQHVGSYQLRKTNSTKPQGFVDVSLLISDETQHPTSYAGSEGGFTLNNSSNITLPIEGGGSGQAYPPKQPLSPLNTSEYPSQINISYTHQTPYPSSSFNPSVGGPSYPSAAGPNYRPPPPPPPPPSNIGYIPTVLPRTDLLSDTYVNMPPSAAAAAPGRGPRPGFALGVGAGALAAGAMIFGDDFMSGFDVPSLIISTDPPF